MVNLKEASIDTTTALNKNIYFTNLDTIRYIAALMVYLQHGIILSFNYLNIENHYVLRLISTVCSGGTGVSVFFVLSGFLITYLLITEHELTGKVLLKNFYLRRIFRIWPLYFAVVAFSFFVYPALKSLIGMNQPLCSNVLYHLVFLSNFDVIHIQNNCFGHDAASQNITWSVSVEEQFYVFWPLIFALVNKKLWKYCILFVIAFSMLFRIINYDNEANLFLHTLAVLVDLGVGGLFAYLIKKQNNVKTFFENTGGKHHALFIIGTFFLLFFGHDIFGFAYGQAVGRIFYACSFAFIIASQAVSKQQSLLNLGNLSSLNKLGKYTYGIYLLHPIVLTILGAVLKLLHLPTDTFITVFLKGVVGYFLTIVISKWSYNNYESRFLELKKKFAIVRTEK